MLCSTLTTVRVPEETISFSGPRPDSLGGKVVGKAEEENRTGSNDGLFLCDFDKRMEGKEEAKSRVYTREAYIYVTVAYGLLLSRVEISPSRRSGRRC